MKEQRNIRIDVVTSDIKPNKRLEKFQTIRQRLQQTGTDVIKQVIVSTANLIGTGVDCLSFCNYLVIFSDLSEVQHYNQVRGRLCRQGQKHGVRIYRFQMDHPVQELIRRRQHGGDATLESIEMS